MEADKRAQIPAHASAIAARLYQQTAPEQVQTLAGIEASVRAHILDHGSPAMADC